MLDGNLDLEKKAKDSDEKIRKQFLQTLAANKKKIEQSKSELARQKVMSAERKKRLDKAVALVAQLKKAAGVS